MSEILLGRPTDEELSDQLLRTAWTPWGKIGCAGFVVAGAGTVIFFSLIAYTVWTGIGVWGNNIPAAWAFAIINFVFWIGIGHAGTFISAILLLLEQRWRTSINRFAEAMTLFAVVQAGIFPLLHLGRPWFAYWLIPYPATMGTWPQFKSALPWDAAAIFTYFTISLVFWYLGLIPDLAAVRDRAPGKARRVIYGIFALGFRGSARDYNHFKVAYGLLAGFATPLVVSVHSIVSSDFATMIVPGWHSTIFPPYFVAGAIFSGFAMVLTLMIPARRAFHMENVITRAHLDSIAKTLLVTGWIVLVSYIAEYFIAWYGGEAADIYQLYIARPTGPGAAVFWAMVTGNVIAPQFLWFPAIRRNPWVLWILSIFINVGMWSERFVIVVQSLEREYLPSAWASYAPTWVDLGILSGSIAFFIFLFLAFLRFVPFIPAFEVKELNHALQEEALECGAATGASHRGRAMEER